jgi:hypothetical protein
MDPGLLPGEKSGALPQKERAGRMSDPTPNFTKQR